MSDAESLTIRRFNPDDIKRANGLSASQRDRPLKIAITS